MKRKNYLLLTAVFVLISLFLMSAPVSADTELSAPVITNAQTVMNPVYDHNADFVYYTYLIDISWNAVPDADNYCVNLYRYNESSQEYVYFYYVYASDTYARCSLLPELIPGETLYAAVTAYSEANSTYSEPSVMYEISVPDTVINEIQLETTKLELNVGKAEYLDYTLSPVDAVSRSIVSASSNPAVATVSGGTVTGVSPGRAVITYAAEYGDAYAVCEVIVTDSESDTSDSKTGSGTCGDNATWQLHETGVLSINGSGKIRDYSADKSWSDYKEYITKVVIEEGITEIGNYAFRGLKALSDVVLPTSLTAIGESAFSSCYALKSITMPNVVSIGQTAFLWCYDLKDITLPDTLESIGRSAFECVGLNEITIPENVSFVENNLFIGCDDLTSISVAEDNPYYHSVDGVLFDTVNNTLVAYPKNKQDKTYSVPDGVEHIGQYAFHYLTNLTEVSLPDTVQTIGIGGFVGCEYLKECNLPENLTEISTSAFSQSGLTHAVLPSGLETLSTSAFYNCKYLDYIVIPKSLTYISEHAFNYCDNLTHVNYEGTASDWNKISIGANNSPLANATINYNTLHAHSGGTSTCSAKAICEICGKDYGSFAHELIYHDHKSSTCTNHGWAAYESCSLCAYSTYEELPLAAHNIQMHGAFPASCEYEGNTTYYKCSVCGTCFSDSDGANVISASDVVTEPLGHDYNDGVCSNCGEVRPGYCGEKLTWELDENGVLTISGTGRMWDSYSWDASKIKGVVIEYGAVNIGSKAFYNSTNLTSISIPESVVSIGSKSFYNCALSSITIPRSVTSISTDAFEGCAQLTVCGRSGSYAETYANDNGFAFSPIAVPYGDVNSDGYINATDSIMLSRFLAGWSGYDTVNIDLYAADADNNGIVVATDGTILSRYLAGWYGYEAIPHV